MSRSNQQKTGGQVRIACAYDKLVPIGKLKPNPANPNKHPKPQIELLAKLIHNHGWRHPVTVSNRSGRIVAGHCRFETAKLLKLKQVPVDYQDFESDAEELAVLVADNTIQELAEIDGLKMADILVELDQVNYDLDLTALGKEQIEDYVTGPTNLQRPEFDEVIDKFGEGKVGLSPKDGNWLYVEFYGDDKRFAQIKKLLSSMMVGKHELNKEKFFEFITQHAKAKHKKPSAKKPSRSTVTKCRRR